MLVTHIHCFAWHFTQILALWFRLLYKVHSLFSLASVPRKVYHLVASLQHSHFLFLLKTTFSRPPNLCSPHRWSLLVLSHCPQQRSLWSWQLPDSSYSHRTTCVRLRTSLWTLSCFLYFRTFTTFAKNLHAPFSLFWRNKIILVRAT